MTRHLLRALVTAAFLLTVGVALPLTARAASQAVTIQDFNFTPQSVTVNVGDSVTWRNAGGESHTATSNNTGFDTGVLNPGASKTIAFGTAGTFDYHCAIHPGMRGSVTVVAAVVTPPPPTPPPTALPTAAPTIAPTFPPTVAPTAAPPTAAPPAPTAATPAAATASASPSAAAVATSSAAAPSAIAAVSPSASASATPARASAPPGDAGRLPMVVGALVVAGIAGLAFYGFRRR